LLTFEEVVFMSLEGQHLGRYRLLRLLGSGGMGEVYLAEDARIGQQVAIKVIRSEGIAYPESENAKEAARLFEREARAIARLDHPNILPLYAYGEEMFHDQPLTYLVMPYRKEGTLASWLRQRGSAALLSPAEVAPLLEQAAGALQHAHSQHVIHQDIKPTNFLIRLREDQPNRPDLLLADFGIAKLTSATASASQSIRGTPTYMAPEQWDGHPLPATDQYALAIMVYELLVGRPPFQGGPGQVMSQHYLALPPAPSTLNPRLSPAIDAVLLIALAKQPNERFHSMTAFARAFQQAVQGSRELPAIEGSSMSAARSNAPGHLKPTLPASNETRSSPTAFATHATSFPTQLAPPALQTLLPTEMARSSTPPAVRADVMITAKPAKRSTSGRIVLIGLAVLVVVALASGITWLTLPHTPPTRGIHASPTGGITEFLLPTLNGSPSGITAGPDGNLWFTEASANQIGRITISGSISEFAIPTLNGSPVAITAGPDGNLWFTEAGRDKIGRITPSGSITEFPLPIPSSSPTGISDSEGITAGPDGNLWFTERSGNKIGQITPTGRITEFPFPASSSSPAGITADPTGITAGPDGNLWFTEYGSDKIGRITTSGNITEFSTPTLGSEPGEITAGPDGTLWFTEIIVNKIGRITTNGSITEFPTPTSHSWPVGITAGPDGNLWFTEYDANKIGRITSGK
jgi:serine/threonine protein kinase/streptogramin lyase